MIKTTILGEKLEKRLNSDIETTLFRVIQEIFNNIAKHSEAEDVLVGLIEENNGIILTVKDNGVGFEMDKITNSSPQEDSTG